MGRITHETKNCVPMDDNIEYCHLVSGDTILIVDRPVHMPSVGEYVTIGECRYTINIVEHYPELLVIKYFITIEE